MARKALVFGCCVLLASVVTACSGDGGDPDECIHHMAPVDVSASERSLSCAESVGFAGVEYRVSCAKVRPDLLGGLVAESNEYDALSIDGIPTSNAVAIGGLDSNGELVRGARCGGRRLATSYSLDRQTTDDLASTVTRPRALR